MKGGVGGTGGIGGGCGRGGSEGLIHCFNFLLKNCVITCCSNCGGRDCGGGGGWN
jgi:hypothetical protein